ncbi:cation/H(+) antiporter 3-like [Hibiscus syriacus]|uniref:cation/H(+) antiporter 3-like n=1 Tax=Hibiscus syriacus TaxID=106335 RepID=UPI00192134E5|nr:cation/H(+) antiporter 3-like [Hibiscus syriacus]
MMLALWCGIFAHRHNESPLVGVFLFGCAVPDGPPLETALVDKFEYFVNGVFLPIYVTTSTMRVDPIAMVADPYARKFSIIFPILTFLAKFLICFVASFWNMMPLRDSLACALIMCSKGGVELAYFSCFRDNKVSRVSPIFIAHNENRAVDSFENIVAFNHYEQNNWGLVKVNAFTAISPPKLMHEDIFNMVLDNEISFIFLPFHRKWCIEGSFEAENNVIRNLNRNVLDRAPCSIGILVDRRRKLSSSKSSSYFIGLLFIGGKDDREGLTLAKRMARDPRVKLTVIHLFSKK